MDCSAHISPCLNRTSRITAVVTHHLYLLGIILKSLAYLIRHLLIVEIARSTVCQYRKSFILRRNYHISPLGVIIYVERHEKTVGGQLSPIPMQLGGRHNFSIRCIEECLRNLRCLLLRHSLGLCRYTHEDNGTSRD